MPPAPTSSSSRSATHSAAAAASNRETTGVPRSSTWRATAGLRQCRRRAASVLVALPPRRSTRGMPSTCGRLRVRDGLPGSTCPASVSATGSCGQRRRRGWMRRYPLVERGSGLAAACRLDGGVTGRLRLKAVDVVPALGFARELGKVAPASVFALLESCRVRGLWRWSGPGWCERGCGRGRVRRVEAPFDRGSEKQGRDKADDRDPGDDEGVFADRLPRVRSVSPPSHNGAKLPHSVEMKTLGGVSIESR